MCAHEDPRQQARCGVGEHGRVDEYVRERDKIDCHETGEAVGATKGRPHDDGQHVRDSVLRESDAVRRHWGHVHVEAVVQQEEHAAKEARKVELTKR